jgi:hypothetical protein
MPDFDGGHYFYTGLAPIRRTSVRRSDGSVTAPSHLVREALAFLPNYSQAKDATRVSPFARSQRTHFVRIAVIDDPAFNGRDPVDAIRQNLPGVGALLDHQPVDYLSRPWLLFEADFDAADGAAATRDGWAAEMWDLAGRELRAVFEHCHGFETVTDGPGFAAYLARGQIETTMSFNDYYIDPLTAPNLSFKRIAAQVLGVLALFLAAAWLLSRELNLGWPLWTAAALLGLGAGLWAAYRLAMSRGARPYPTADGSDLPTVLKALYLQQSFTRFATDHQGDTPDRLHAAFGTFLADHQPANLVEPTQTPGVLES